MFSVQCWTFDFRRLQKEGRFSPAGAPAGALGFTLIEVLISVVILSTGIVLVLRAFETCLVALGEARDGLRAAHLVQVRFNSMRSGLAVGDGIEAGSIGAFDEPYRDYRWRVEKQSTGLGVADRSVTNSLERVDVAVWREGSPVKYTASTYLRAEN